MPEPSLPTRHQADCTWSGSAACPDRAASDWDALVPRSAAGFYLCHDWLASIRGTKGYHEQTWSISDSERNLVGLVPVSTADDGPRNNDLYDLYRLFGDNRTGDAARWSPQTLIGSRSGYVNEPLVRDGALLPVWVRACLDAVSESGCRSAAIPYLDAASAGPLTGLLPGRPVLLSGGRCVLDVKGGDIEEFVAGLGSSARHAIRTDRREFARGGRQLTVGPLDPSMIDSLAPLLANVQHRHGSVVTVGQVAATLRGYCAAGLAERAVVFGCREGADLIAFSLCYRFGDALTLRVVGLDYARIGRRAEYFMLLVYEPVRYALQHRLTSIDLGAEGFRAKIRRGARFVPLWSIMLASPMPWEAHNVHTHDASVVDSWRQSFGDLIPDLEERCALPGAAVVPAADPTSPSDHDREETHETRSASAR